MMPLRDGVKLATDVFLPPEGKGPWPAVMLRTQYSRWDARAMAPLAGVACVLVLQNVRGSYGSEGAGTYDPTTFDMDMNDSYDAVEWVASQKWSNGKVGMWGPSGHGIAACNALWALPPHLTVIDVNVTGDNAYLHWTFLNGARRYEYSWLSQRGHKTKNNEWPRPTTVPFDVKGYHDFIGSKAPQIKTYYRMNAGWFDLFSEAALDHFAVLAPHGRAYVQVGSGGHGPMGGDLTFKARNQMPAEARRSSRGLKECLGGEPDASVGSCLAYFLMGDARDGSAPGNVWMTSEKWPVEHTPTSYYLRADGTLTTAGATEGGVSVVLRSDPRDPVPSMGGNYAVGKAKDSPIGPLDQRPQADRKDIVRFKTAPLESPVGVTGKVWLELHVSSDCPDTMFVARLVDIYPDGYEALIRESAMLGRYHGGLDKPSPLEAGKVVKLSMDMWSTALVFNKGHRIGLYIMGSSDPAFEVHPNTYEPVGSIEESRVAENRIHVSGESASKLILPVVAPETYMNVGGTR
jgi:predicted acyl esterase